MPRPKPVVFGLYAWTPDYGFRYIHPANRRTFEWLEPTGKLFEKIDETDDWILLRYDEQQFKVSAELFTELPDKPAFSFGDLVEEAQPEPGRKPHQGLISDVFWDEARHQARFQIVEKKRKLKRIFEATELRLV
ncbi:hypothetical protein SAMN02745146_3579 [Hymenobacter daecheongensis DSM 21074]|uniref:Uncharacterized protein n=1 Tax=Hymenobacter daecheongensis DSM 21074 TaxID=1121955 RepID=A0A1M6KVI6_9BACT|nr:hypothetical protein [Hymenobacter daecheongensis]SHJ62949.1 hypothetical protein SAMN02745146_3579 [Hymenobacter daecheongensis DSM 21074]